MELITHAFQMYGWVLDTTILESQTKETPLVFFEREEGVMITPVQVIFLIS